MISTIENTMAAEPEKLRLEQQEDLPRIRRTPDGRLMLHAHGKDVVVKVRPCFPWSDPNRYLSLRDDENSEHLIIHELDDLDPASAAAVRESLREAHFTFEVLSIEAIDKNFDLRVWRVQTTQGPRSFLIKLDNWPRELDDGSLVINDLSGDLYYIKDPDKLDPKSRKLIYAYRR